MRELILIYNNNKEKLEKTKKGEFYEKRSICNFF